MIQVFWISAAIICIILLAGCIGRLLNNDGRRFKKLEKKIKTKIEEKMDEKYGECVCQWFRFDRVVFWAFTDSLDRIRGAIDREIRNKIVFNAVSALEQKLRKKCPGYEGRFNIFVPFIEEGSEIKWMYQFIGTDDDLLDSSEDVSASVYDDFNKLLNNEEK